MITLKMKSESSTNGVIEEITGNIDMQPEELNECRVIEIKEENVMKSLKVSRRK